MLFGKNVNQYYFKYFHLLIVGILALLLVDYIQLLIPENYGNLIDLISNQTLTNEALFKIIYNMLFITLCMFVGRFLWRISVLNIGVKVETKLREKMFIKMESLSQDYFQIHKTGAQMALYTNDLMSIKTCFSDGIIMFIDAFFLGGLAIYKMIRLDLLMTCIASIPLVLLGICGGIIGKAIDKRYDARQRAFEKLSEFTQENFSGIAVIKAYVKEKLELREFVKINKNFSDKNVSFIKFAVSLDVLFSTLISSIVVIIIGYGTHLIITTSGSDMPFTAGQLIQFISYFGQLTWPALALANLINIHSQGRASLKRINELLDYPISVKDDKNCVMVDELEGLIECKNLTFTYPGAQNPSLENISFTIRPKEKIGIIGKTGCGKTTLVDLLTRIYNVDEGCLYIDGIDIMQLPIQKVRDLISYVPQDNFLFNDTILNNIAFSQKSLSLEQAILFAKYACVDDNIQEFPLKYETMIGERGVSLSGGQKQRISMARAMAKNAKILILDDSVSAVDTKTEANILDTIHRDFKDKTIIMIAHRVSTIASLDKIILMDNGKIIAIGSNDELYDKVPMYREIVDLQHLEGGEDE